METGRVTPQIRKDPVKGEWVIISSERANRPSGFSQPIDEKEGRPPDDCPFCEGNESLTPPEIKAVRENGASNGPGWSIRVVPNKYSALDPEASNSLIEDDLYPFTDGFGFHELVIEGPDHGKEIPDRSLESLEKIFEVYKERSEKLAQKEDIRNVLIFKNYRARAGASLDHPHTQIIATPFVPKEIENELEHSREYQQRKGRCIFCDILTREVRQGDRLLFENEAFVSYVPFAPRFPYEIRIVPKKHRPRFQETGKDCSTQLGEILKKNLHQLRKLSGDAAYNYYIHSAPATDYTTDDYSSFHWHLTIVPRLTILAGFELGSGNLINPVNPEEAAKDLRKERRLSDRKPKKPPD